MKPSPLAPLALVLCAAACAGRAGGASPRGTLESFRAAVRREDYAAIYAMLPSSARRAETLAQFDARMRADRAELAAVGDGVDRAFSDGRVPSVEVPMREGGAAAAVEDPGGWRVARAGFGPATPATPQDAARALHAALVRQSLPAVLQVMSDRARGTLRAEMASLVDALADPSGLEVTMTSAQRASIRLPDGRVIVVVLEGNVWRVEEVQ